MPLPATARDVSTALSLSPFVTLLHDMQSAKATPLNEISIIACEEPVNFPGVTMMAIFTITTVSTFYNYAEITHLCLTGLCVSMQTQIRSPKVSLGNLVDCCNSFRDAPTKKVSNIITKKHTSTPILHMHAPNTV